MTYEAQLWTRCHKKSQVVPLQVIKFLHSRFGENEWLEQEQGKKNRITKTKTVYSITFDNSIRCFAQPTSPI